MLSVKHKNWWSKKYTSSLWNRSILTESISFQNIPKQRTMTDTDIWQTIKSNEYIFQRKKHKIEFLLNEYGTKRML